MGWNTSTQTGSGSAQTIFAGGCPIASGRSEAASRRRRARRRRHLVGLGTGSTVAHLLPALAARRLDIRCVATSPATERDGARARARGVPFDGIERLDIAIDGADQVDPAGWLVKGGGGAHVREKIVARAARAFVVIVSADKAVDRDRAADPARAARASASTRRSPRSARA